MAAAEAPGIDALSAADEPQVTVRYKAILTVLVMAGMLMQVLDITIANVALPHMQAALGATQESITWVLTSYILASAIAIPLTGWLADRFGSRNLFLFSIALFMGASMLCGIANSLTEMVLFRLLQGIGGAFLGPLAQSIMLDINRPSRHARAMSIYAMGVMIGPIMGPIAGGWLTENYDWRWVYFINIPLGAVCLVGLWFLLPRRDTHPRRFDLIGWALLSIALASLQLMLDRGPHADWLNSREIWIEGGLAVACFWMFGVHLVTSRAPLFPAAMIRDRNMLTGGMFLFVMGMVMMAAMSLLPAMLQSLFGYSVMDTGILMATRGIGVILTIEISGRLVTRFDSRLFVAFGFSVMALSLWLMTGWSLDMDWHPVVLSGFIQGLGLGCIFVPLNLLSFATLPAHYRTDAASLLNLGRSIGSSIGIAITSALLARNIQVSHQDLSAHVTPYNLPADPALLGMTGSGGDSVMMMVDSIVNQQAAMIAYLDDFKLMALATALVLPLVLLLRPPQRTDDDTPHMVME